MKKLLKQILSELRGIRKALEPKVTPEPVNYPGRNNDVCNQVYSSSADQKPKYEKVCEGCGDDISHREGKNKVLCTKCDGTYYQQKMNQKPKLPESWYELSEEQRISTLRPAYQSFDALRWLYDLRQAYWQVENWEPDWKDITQEKECIIFEDNELGFIDGYHIQRFLAFKAGTGQAEHFLKHHRALIEQAKELL